MNRLQHIDDNYEKNMTMQGRLGIVVAMTSEVDALFGRRKLRKGSGESLRSISLDSNSPYSALCCGIGRQRAREAAEQLVQQGVKALLSVGMAGGLDPSLRAGDFVIALDGYSLDPVGQIQTWSSDPAWCRLVQSLLSQHGGGACASLVTVDEPVSSTDDKAALFKQTGAAVVDMESAAVAAVAHQANIPFLGIRVVCDDAQASIPTEMTEWLNLYGEIRIGRVVRDMIIQPRLIAKAFTMSKHFKVAQTVLTASWQQLESAIPSFEGMENCV